MPITKLEFELGITKKELTNVVINALREAKEETKEDTGKYIVDCIFEVLKEKGGI